MSPYFTRRLVIVTGVTIQALAVFGMMLIALLTPENSVACLIGLAVIYQVCANFVQPQWRGWMGSLVPPRRRGAFFAGRTQLTMLTVFAVFVGGGVLLGAFQEMGAALKGFTLSTANYIYDLRPPRADFASYAAVQSSLGATGVFLGALAGGVLATAMAKYAPCLPDVIQPTHPVVLIFLVSACLRLGIVCWFIPHLRELRVREHPGVMQIIYRISRFTPGAGVVLDWLTVSRKK